MGKVASKISMSTHCTLWKCDYSPACRAVLMGLDAMNVSLTEVDVDMDKAEHRTPEIIAMNPHQTLPILKDRELILYDSHAINTYLAAQYCEGDKLLPRNPAGRAIVDQLLHYESGILYPHYRASAYPILYENCRFVMPQQIKEVDYAYQDLETMLRDRTWFGGSHMTLADISIAATVSTLNVLVPIDKEKYEYTEPFLIKKIVQPPSSNLDIVFGSSQIQYPSSSCFLDIILLQAMERLESSGDEKYPGLASWMFRISKEPFYTTGNLKGLNEFTKRIDTGNVLDSDNDLKKCPRTSLTRRSLGGRLAET